MLHLVHVEQQVLMVMVQKVKMVEEEEKEKMEDMEQMENHYKSKLLDHQIILELLLTERNKQFILHTYHSKDHNSQDSFTSKLQVEMEEEEESKWREF